MTRRIRVDDNLLSIGKIIKDLRMDLLLEKKSREYFLNDRILKGLIEESSISLETLKNIENGNTLPSITTLKTLSIALEIDFFDLLDKIYDYI
ncbi:helix-turn-helix domain-containing protein [Streptococcus hyovaginalis]|uniref:helix-turn-helix domain-containing protein n=1 Tax=Streptococcus hyovaginalis TaxID=149015 RepID=UPI001BB14247|nr:helix-turn-helix domain-containing protein [Streptococcus hyovaginalis]